ncbi:2Fe-2S iron-sulfur cluster-binding protein [Undibacterium sp. MH2W]|uniref:2Fe-2S iron-sulfur cluster-binding protein n=1 Tax=Undibacterium sp. MH2W TaxID=3413044 RepID=UPI003BF1BF89
MEESSQIVHLTISPQEWQCIVPTGKTLLEASLAAGIRLPSSCRNGTCRACMCQLIEGKIRYRIEWPGLSAEEKQASWILPCVAEAEGAVVIRAPLAVKV